jgi:hypothetical protein
VPAVAPALLVAEPGRRLDRKPGVLPGHDPTGERDGVGIARFGERVRDPQRAVPVRAVDDERAVAMLLELVRELAHRDPEPTRDPAGLPLAGLADVDERRFVLAAQQLLGPSEVDLPEKLAVTRHAPRIIVGR